MLAATMPTMPAAIHSIVSIKRSIEARMSAPHGLGIAGEHGGRTIPPPWQYVTGSYCVKAWYWARAARSSDIAASGSVPVFLTPSAQVLISGSEAFFQSAV